MKCLFALALSLLPATAYAQDAVVNTVATAPSVTDAPGRGVIPRVHTASFANLFDLDQQPLEQISPLIQRQFISGAQSTVTKWTVKAGGVFPLHHHPYEQTTWIMKGKCDVFSQGRKYAVTAGMMIVFPPNVPHEFICPEDTIDIDFFAPQRQDWMDGVPPAAATSKK